jgi:uncharacterized protein
LAPTLFQLRESRSATQQVRSAKGAGAGMSFGLQPDSFTKIQKVFAAVPRIEEVVIFGSRALGTHNNGSDVDLALRGEGLGFTEIHNCNQALDDLLLPYTFDLCLEASITNEDLKAHILRVGKVFYTKAQQI